MQSQRTAHLCAQFAFKPTSASAAQLNTATAAATSAAAATSVVAAPATTDSNNDHNEAAEC